MSDLIPKIREAIIGDRRPIQTPFGEKPLVYADYTASGRSLSFLEDYIRNEVLPCYANTHTEASFTGAHTTALREQARDIIRKAVGGTEQDKVIFCGSGATAAINKLIDILGLRTQGELADAMKDDSSDRPVVFIGPYEHHSNELPWRESDADVVTVPLDDNGQLDLAALGDALSTYAHRPLRIGSFSAASNVTGIKTDVPAVTAVLKAHGALAFWDYAAAAPYVAINMNGSAPIDAIFMSPHKFIGGPGTPGVLVVKQRLLTNPVPAVVGGGTVSWVSPMTHRFVEDSERREEGGTPAIVESIRAGLVFKLQQEVGLEEIERREQNFISRALERLSRTPNLEILGPTDVPRLSILSLRFRRSGRDLHYGYVVALLNDLFGIQVRGGCSCAGPYGHALLSIDEERSRAIASQIAEGRSVLRPGWVRLNFNYFLSEEEFEYLLSAIELVAEHGWRLLSHYVLDERNGIWRHRDAATVEHSSLLDEAVFEDTGSASKYAPVPLAPLTTVAKSVLLGADVGERMALEDDQAIDDPLRWFALASDGASEAAQNLNEIVV